MPGQYERGRISILRMILKLCSLGLLPIEIRVNDPQKEHKNIRKMLNRRGKGYDIGMTKDPDRRSIWFYKRK